MSDMSRVYEHHVTFTEALMFTLQEGSSADFGECDTSTTALSDFGCNACTNLSTSFRAWNSSFSMIMLIRKIRVPFSFSSWTKVNQNQWMNKWSAKSYFYMKRTWALSWLETRQFWCCLRSLLNQSLKVDVTRDSVMNRNDCTGCTLFHCKCNTK